MDNKDDLQKTIFLLLPFLLQHLKENNIEEGSCCQTLKHCDSDCLSLSLRRDGGCEAKPNTNTHRRYQRKDCYVDNHQGCLHPASHELYTTAEGDDILVGSNGKEEIPDSSRRVR